MKILMKNQSKQLKSLILLLVFASVFCCGCSIKNIQKGTIKIRHESKIKSIKENYEAQNSKKGIVKKSSGVIIYKDNSTQNFDGLKNVNFGPRDINFDIKVKVK